MDAAHPAAGAASNTSALTPLQLDIHDAVEEIRPGRKLLRIQTLAGANTNNAFLVTLETETTERQEAVPGSENKHAKLVVREAAGDVEFIDRALEMDVLRTIPQWLGPKLLLATVGPRTGAALHVSEFLPGQDLERIDVGNQPDIEQITHRLATLHSLSMTHLDGRAPAILRQLVSFSESCRETLKSRTPFEPAVEGEAATPSHATAQTYQSIMLTSSFLEAEVQQLVFAIVEHFGITQQPDGRFSVNHFSHSQQASGAAAAAPKLVGLGHNDAQPGNWRRGVDGWLFLLDYEYADWNLVAGDIANTLAESAFAYLVPADTLHGFIWKPERVPTLSEIRSAAATYLQQASLVASQRSAHNADFELDDFSCSCCSTSDPADDAVEQLAYDIMLLTPAVHLAWAAWAFDLAVSRQPEGPETPFEFDYAAYAQCRLSAFKTSKEAVEQACKVLEKDNLLHFELSAAQKTDLRSLQQCLLKQPEYTPLFCTPRRLDTSSSASQSSARDGSPRGDTNSTGGGSFTTAHASPDIPPFAPPPRPGYAPPPPLDGAVRAAGPPRAALPPTVSLTSRQRSPGSGGPAPVSAASPPWSSQYTPPSRACSAPAAAPQAHRGVAKRAMAVAQVKLPLQLSTPPSPQGTVTDGELLRCLAAVSTTGTAHATESPTFQGAHPHRSLGEGSIRGAAGPGRPPSPPSTRAPSAWTTCMCVQLCGTRAYVPTVASVAMSVFGRVLSSSGLGNSDAAEHRGTGAGVRSSRVAHSEVLRRVSPRGAMGAFWLDESLPVVEEADDSDDDGGEMPAHPPIAPQAVEVSPVASPTPGTATSPNASPARPIARK